jgi:hypothetical protein
MILLKSVGGISENQVSMEYVLLISQKFCSSPEQLFPLVWRYRRAPKQQ